MPPGATPDPLLVPIIAACATIGAAIISALIAKYGLGFWRATKTYRLHGESSDLNTVLWTGEVLRPVNPFTYRFRDAELAIKGERASLSGEISVFKMGSNEQVGSGKLSAKGSTESGVVHLTYKIVDAASNEHWDGVLMIRVAKMGELHGLWLSDSHAHAGSCTFGRLMFRRR